MTTKTLNLAGFEIANDKPFFLMAGPCQIESLQHTQDMCGALKEITTRLGIPFVYKSSFDKANRTSLNAQRGVGIDKGLEIFTQIKKEFDVPVVTDIHLPEQCAEVGAVCDILQIPAFLCRQTDLLIAAAETGRIINVKKGQFLAPWDMAKVAEKLAASGNENIMLCERGASFGYNTLVSDMRSLPTMAKTGYPVVYDATHSVQQPGGLGGSSGGDRTMVPVLARAAVAVGVAGLFMETHEDPDSAPSDGPNMVPLSEMEELLSTLIKFDKIAKS
ncbi:MAG: 3-deoxy-8-phosphooctulonate synthase [Alphaproteobacteria bacterium]|nr:3-deoxy-8-phosphooctulonate synthase [Alphaproteobacteria bacterium]|tara:strand:- start:18644 stop:19468 length:825 start_codon:yes stop_codon:yes gene_type:complete